MTKVTFRWRDSAHNNEQKLMTLSLDEFLRRFLLHLLPKGFVRIRHFGFLANRRRATLLPLCFQLLGAVQPPQTEPEASRCQGTEPSLALSQMWRPHGGHRETYCCPDPTPFSTLSRRSRGMKLQFRSRSLGASPSPAGRGAPLLPPTKLLASNFRTQTTIEPILPALRFSSITDSPSLSHHRNTIEFA